MWLSTSNISGSTTFLAPCSPHQYKSNPYPFVPRSQRIHVGSGRLVEFCGNKEGSGFLLGKPHGIPKSLPSLPQAMQKEQCFANRFEAQVPEGQFEHIMLEGPILLSFPHSLWRKPTSGLILNVKCSRNVHPATLSTLSPSTLLSASTYSSYTSHPRAPFLS